MSTDSSRTQSRRTLLAASFGGVAALAAHALGRPAPTRAEGENIQVGGEYYNATSKTYIANNTNNDYVLAAQSTKGGIALSGVSNSHYGVIGSSPYVGVQGESTGGSAVSGHVTGQFGIGVRASTAQPSAFALWADGKLFFRRSGIASIAVGSKSKAVSPGYDFVVETQVFCTLDSNQAGLYLQRIVISRGGGAAADKFTVFLSAKVASGKYARVCWFIVK